MTSSAGIGLTTAKLLHSLGCKVIIGDVAPPSSTVDVPKRDFHFHKTDVANYASMLSLFDETKRVFGRAADVVFANAGIGERGQTFPVLDDLPSDDEMRREPSDGNKVVDIDLTGVIYTVRLAIWTMRKDGIKDGSVIVTASMAGYAGQPGLPVYNAAKHACVGLVRGLRYHTLQHGIALSLVAPTITSTPIVLQELPYHKDDSNKQLEVEQVTKAFERAGVPVNTPEHVARVVAQLVKGGKKSNGKGVLVQGGLQYELEGPINQSRNIWMGEKMLQLYKGGSGGPVTIGGSRGEDERQSKL